MLFVSIVQLSVKSQLFGLSRKRAGLIDVPNSMR